MPNSFKLSYKNTIRMITKTIQILQISCFGYSSTLRRPKWAELVGFWGPWDPGASTVSELYNRNLSVSLKLPKSSGTSLSWHIFACWTRIWPQLLEIFWTSLSKIHFFAISGVKVCFLAILSMLLSLGWVFALEPNNNWSQYIAQENMVAKR